MELYGRFPDCLPDYTLAPAAPHSGPIQPWEYLGFPDYFNPEEARIQKRASLEGLLLRAFREIRLDELEQIIRTKNLGKFASLGEINPYEG